MAPSTSATTSLLTPIGYQSGDCGYCKGEETSQRTPDSRASYYVRSNRLTPEHYQELMDRGWRRSGSLLYLPDASRSCCPHYTIRLPAAQFTPSRDQRQTLFRWNRFVLGEDYIKQEKLKFPRTKEQKKAAETFSLLPTLHASESSSLHKTLIPAHEFTITLESSTFTEEKYLLYAHYQSQIHHDPPAEISRSGFRRFLCDSPLVTSPAPPVGSSSRALGSYHHLYRLGGRLIAMAVLDLLPRGVSAVYFIYHTDFEKFSLGKVSAMREAGLALEDGYENYYMGYYIHECRKMRYKADFSPQYVLDFETFEWELLDDGVKGLMEKRNFAGASREKRSLRARRSDAAEGTDGHDHEDDADDDDEPDPYPTPLLATQSNLSLLSLGMPGVMTLGQVKEEVDLDAMRVKVGVGGGQIVRVDRLVAWEGDGDEDEQEESLRKDSLKGTFAEFAAAVGPKVAREVVVDFS
ncbi:arginine-tRNA-protein transferase [Zymoseptoria brevis]|uniref:arginyltransferase n=1 Tax=Zymoseptoria brevis TaxID=1047168 RepID=A0A0F4GK42_9PEZI|nr:arginine-tRNA-protein transferase [Zymoseptoria brevis]